MDSNHRPTSLEGAYRGYMVVRLAHAAPPLTHALDDTSPPVAYLRASSYHGVISGHSRETWPPIGH